MAFRKLNRVGLPGEHRYNRGTDEEPLLYSSKGEQQIMQTKSGQRWSAFWTLITITAALAAVTALIVGSIALRNTNEGLIGKISNLIMGDFYAMGNGTIDGSLVVGGGISSRKRAEGEMAVDVNGPSRFSGDVSASTTLTVGDANAGRKRGSEAEKHQQRGNSRGRTRAACRAEKLTVRGSASLCGGIQVNGTSNLTDTNVNGTLTVTNLTVLNTATIDRLVINMNVTTLTALTATVQNLFASVVNAAAAVFGSVSATNLSTNMLSFVPLSVTTNIVLPATHNTFHLSHALTGLNVTLPADLTLMIGKEIQVCNADGKRHVLDATPVGKWDTKNFWSVIRFDQNSAGCCVTFKVLTASKVSLVSRSEQCTTFCATNDLYHCVDVERPEATNPWHGWWKSTLKSRFGNAYRTPQAPFVFINSAQVPHQITYYAGDVNQPREPTPYDRSPPVLRVRSLYPKNGHSILLDEPNGDLEKNDRFTAFALVMQSGSQKFIEHRVDLSNEFPAPDSYVGLFEKIDERSIPLIIPSKTGTVSQTSPDDPRSIFRSFVNTMLYEAHGSIAVDRNDENFIGEPASVALMEELMSSTITHTNNVYQIFSTQNPTEGLTRIRTENYHHVVPAAKVTISDCTGPWVSLNGVHEISAGMTTNNILADPVFQDYNSTDPAKRSFHHDVVIFFNSNGFPTDGSTGIATSTGPCKLSVSYGPLTSASEYAETQSVLYYWGYESFKIFLHFYLNMYFDSRSFNSSSAITTYKPLETWSSVQNSIDSGTVTTSNVRSRSHGIASGYYATTIRDIMYFFQSGLENRLIDFDFNNRFELRPDISGNEFLIGKENYLTDARHLLIRCKQSGNIRTSDNNLFAGSEYGSLDGGCDTLEARVTAFGDIPSASENYFILGIDGKKPQSLDPEEYAIFAESYFFGRINTTYTNGVNIGYIRLADAQLTDPYFFSWSEDFAPDATLSEDFKQMLGVASYFAEIMRYIVTDLECEHVIFDIRHNGGGYSQLSFILRGFFGSGDDALSLSFKQPVAGNNYAPSVDLENFQYASERFVPAGLLIDVSRSSTVQGYYPDSVFQNGQVVILTDSRAASAGDVFPGVWLGPNFDLNIGANTTTRIVGDLDGRLAGCSTAGYSTPTSRDGSRIKNSNGTPRPGYIARMDSQCSIRRANGVSFANRVPALAPSCTPTLRGLAGGCPLPNDYETLLYPDLGYKPNYRARLPGDDRPTTPTTAVKWEHRDAWLEQAIDSVFPGLAVLENNKLSTTTASATVTVTTTAPHGLATGWIVTISGVSSDVEGIPHAQLNKQHAITVSGANTFTITVATVATGTNAATGGSFFVRHRDLSARKKRDPRATTKKRPTVQRKMVAPREKIAQLSNRIKRDISCPTGMTLVPIQNVNRTVAVEVHIEDREDATPIKIAKSEMISIFHHEMVTGGICMSEEGHVMVTPLCQGLPKLVRV